MTKVIAWIIVIFLVLFALRIVNQGKARARRKEAETQAKVTGTATVRCSRCGVFLPVIRCPRKRGQVRVCGLELLARAMSSSQPHPATPPFEPPSSSLLNDSSRRMLWMVGLFRAICGAFLLGTALFFDLNALQIKAPNAFLSAAGLYFLFGLASFAWVQRESLGVRLPILLIALLIGDVLFIGLLMFAGGIAAGPLSILLLPQLAASGWLLRSQIAFFHAALASSSLLMLDAWRLIQNDIGGAQLFQTGLIGLAYFAVVAISLALGRYTKASEDLAAQRGIDVANLEQVNRLIIQDMQDGVLVVDLNGVVRGHNAQVTRLLGGFGRMRGGMRLPEFSSTLHDYWRRWQEDFAEPLPPFKVDSTQRLLRVRLVRIGSGLNGGTLIYLEDLGRAQTEAQQMKLAAMGRLTASIAHEVRNPLSAINQAAQILEEDGSVAPEGARLLTMIRNNAKRIDRIVGEVLQLNRRDRQQPEVIALGDFVALAPRRGHAGGGHSFELRHAAGLGRAPDHLRSRSPEPDRLEPGTKCLAALPEKGRKYPCLCSGWIHGRRRNMRADRRRLGYSGGAARADLRALLHHAPRWHRPRSCTSHASSPTRTALHWSCSPKGPGAHFRMTMKRALGPITK